MDTQSVQIMSLTFMVINSVVFRSESTRCTDIISIRVHRIRRHSSHSREGMSYGRMEMMYRYQITSYEVHESFDTIVNL